MVRTYRTERYELISPWQQAMKNADQGVSRPIVTGKRTYSDVNVSQRSGQKNLKLPPMSDDKNQLTQFFSDEVGKVLSRSKDRLRKIKLEVILYDPLETGYMSKSAACEILKRYDVPKDEGYQRKLVEIFTHSHDKSQIDRKAFVEFLENSRKGTNKRNELIQQEQKQQQQQPHQQNFADRQLGRYDSQPTMQQEQMPTAKRGELVRQAFVERRDAGLLLEIENALESYSAVNPNDLINKLENYLLSTCRDESNLVDNMHMKGLVDKHQFPINSALTMKCIERLDPHDHGQIEWPKFIAFLRRAVQNSPSRNQSQQSTSGGRQSTSGVTSKSDGQTLVPETPAWESRKPLSSISRDDKKNGSNTSERLDANYYNNSQNERTYDRLSHETESPFRINENLFNSSNISQNNDYQGSNNYQQSSDDYFEAKRENRNEKSYDMGDDLEAAFAYNLNKIKNGGDDFPTTSEKNIDQKFQTMGLRGEAYKRVADALQDKAKFSKGVVETAEVQKLVNYYNLLFDTNLPMDQLEQVLAKHSSGGQVQVQQVIDSFGTDII